jgi:hypothetical protein
MSYVTGQLYSLVGVGHGRLPDAAPCPAGQLPCRLRCAVDHRQPPVSDTRAFLVDGINLA